MKTALAQTDPPEKDSGSGRPAVLWLGLLAAWVVALAVLSWQHPGWILEISPSSLKLFLLQWGMWKAAALYILLYVFTVRPFVPVPPKIYTLGGGLLFGPLLGTFLAVLAATGNACVTFLIGKYLAKSSIERYLGPVLRHADRHVRQAGFRSIFLARVCPTGIPFDVISYAASMTPVRLRDYALGTLAGVIPAMAVNSYLGHFLTQGWMAASTLLLAALCGGGLLLIWRRYSRVLVR